MGGGAGVIERTKFLNKWNRCSQYGGFLWDVVPHGNIISSSPREPHPEFHAHSALHDVPELSQGSHQAFSISHISSSVVSCLPLDAEDPCPAPSGMTLSHSLFVLHTFPSQAFHLVSMPLRQHGWDSPEVGMSQIQIEQQRESPICFAQLANAWQFRVTGAVDLL